MPEAWSHGVFFRIHQDLHLAGVSPCHNWQIMDVENNISITERPQDAHSSPTGWPEELEFLSSLKSVPNLAEIYRKASSEQKCWDDQFAFRISFKLYSQLEFYVTICSWTWQSLLSYYTANISLQGWIILLLFHIRPRFSLSVFPGHILFSPVCHFNIEFHAYMSCL